MTRDEEIWGVAVALIKRFGHDAPLHAAERIGAAIVLSDEVGLNLGRSIAEKISAIIFGDNLFR